MNTPCGFDHESVCLGKHPFDNRRDARTALRRITDSRIFRKDGHQTFKQQLRVYKCPYCSAFHMGHGPRSRRG